MSVSITNKVATILALISATMAAKLGVYNNCNYPIFATAARNSDPVDFPNGIEDPFTEVPCGHLFRTQRIFEAAHDNIGRTLKVRDSADTQSPYQLQVTQTPDGRMHYDVSTKDGNPFKDEHRSVMVLDARHCPTIVCHPGDSLCEDKTPTQACDTEEDIILTVC